MDNVIIRIYYDFASTLCYLSHRVLSELDEEIAALGIELEWKPIDLTMIVPWDRGDSFTPEIRQAVHGTGVSLGIEVEMPDPWLDSRPASQIALAMPCARSEARWRSSVFYAFFEERARELSDRQMELAAKLLDGAEHGAENHDFNRVLATTEEAIALGIEGVPTLLADTWLAGGVYDSETMLKLLSELGDRCREGDSMVN